jgi:hypothetical protein
MVAEAAEAAGAPEDYTAELRSRQCKGVETVLEETPPDD